MPTFIANLACGRSKNGDGNDAMLGQLNGLWVYSLSPSMKRRYSDCIDTCSSVIAISVNQRFRADLPMFEVEGCPRDARRKGEAGDEVLYVSLELTS